MFSVVEDAVNGPGGYLFIGRATPAPAVVEYVPVPQSVHAAPPVSILYFPATHDVQTPPFGPVEPALHVQAATAELGLGELELAGQLVHAAFRMKTFAPLRTFSSCV